MQNRREIAIPAMGKADDEHWPSWAEVLGAPIVENHEGLVPLSLVPEKILVRSAYYEVGIMGSHPECYAREEVFEKLFHAASLLPSDLRMVVLDAWRSPVVQKELFTRCCAAFRGIHKKASEEEIIALAQQYVALPSVSATSPSPHVTGGAVDVSIATRGGKMLSFGSVFDYPKEISYTRALENMLGQCEGNEKLLRENERQGLENRRLLYSVMIEAGFVNYSCEWWHFEYGTQRWALCSGHDYAIYGPASLSLDSFAALAEEMA